MDPEDQQQILELLQKHINDGDSLADAIQKVLDEGYDKTVVQQTASGLKPQPEQYDLGNAILAESDVRVDTRNYMRKRYMRGGTFIGLALGLVLLFFPWRNVDCHSSFYRSFFQSYPSTCTSLRVTGLPFPVNGYVTAPEQLPSGKVANTSVNVAGLGVARNILAFDAIIWCAVGLGMLSVSAK